MQNDLRTCELKQREVGPRYSRHGGGFPLFAVAALWLVTALASAGRSPMPTTNTAILLTSYTDRMGTVLNVRIDSDDTPVVCPWQRQIVSSADQLMPVENSWIIRRRETVAMSGTDSRGPIAQL